MQSISNFDEAGWYPFKYYLQGFLSLVAYAQGREPFASYESLEQLHRFLFVLGITHVSYSFVTIALSMLKVSYPFFNVYCTSLHFQCVSMFLEFLSQECLKYSPNSCRSIAGEHGKIRQGQWLFRAYKVNIFLVLGWTLGDILSLIFLKW